MDSLLVEGLGKRYFIPSKRAAAEPRKTLNLGFHPHAAAEVLAARARPGAGHDLWALRHVSFAVAPGTILGVIGANGAGKSTLLKIIARVTRPTEGRVVGIGRVVSLLELGAGFNPDFSAHDNILMNAAMHGISRQEALDRMPEIIEFAELDEFTDNPLRQYSSGMYLRLAFSVAMNMQPDILLADEILAVGDIAFQERCLQRVAEEAARGLTVLFVSHDMAAVARLCHRIIWLDKGEVMQDGEPERVVAEYEDAALRGYGREAAVGRADRTPHQRRGGDRVGSPAECAARGDRRGADDGRRVRADPAQGPEAGRHASRIHRLLRQAGSGVSHRPRPRNSSPTAAAWSTCSCGFPRTCSPRRPTP